MNLEKSKYLVIWTEEVPKKLLTCHLSTKIRCSKLWLSKGSALGKQRYICAAPMGVLASPLPTYGGLFGYIRIHLNVHMLRWIGILIC